MEELEKLKRDVEGWLNEYLDMRPKGDNSDDAKDWSRVAEHEEWMAENYHVILNRLDKIIGRQKELNAFTIKPTVKWHTEEEVINDT